MDSIWVDTPDMKELLDEIKKLENNAEKIINLEEKFTENETEKETSKVSIGELKYIFCSLIRERISVKDVIYVFEKINDFADDNSKAVLLEKLRISFSRKICWSISNKDKEIEAYELSDELISALEENAVEPDEGESIVKIDGLQFEDMVRKIAEISLEKPVVLVVPGHIRAVVFALVSQLYMDIPTISFDEIAPEFELKILGKI